MSTITQPPVVTGRPIGREPSPADGWGAVSVGPLLRRLHQRAGATVSDVDLSWMDTMAAASLGGGP